MPPARRAASSARAATSLLTALIGLVALGGPALAAGGETPGEGAGNESLAQKAADPTAALMSLQLSDVYTESLHGLDGTANQLLFRAAIPWQFAGGQHIFRITQAYVTSTPGGASGLADTQVFDMATFGRAWGRIGAGLVASFPTGNSEVSYRKWTLGPAVGFVNSQNKGQNWGLFLQGFYSVAGDSDAPDVGLLNLQPIYSYQLGQGRTVSLGNSALVYDTRHSSWASLLVGINYAQIVRLGGRNWRPNAEIDYDFKDDRGNQEWVWRLGIVLLLPK